MHESDRKAVRNLAAIVKAYKTRTQHVLSPIFLAWLSTPETIATWFALWTLQAQYADVHCFNTQSCKQIQKHRVKATRVKWLLRRRQLPGFFPGPTSPYTPLRSEARAAKRRTASPACSITCSISPPSIRTLFAHSTDPARLSCACSNLCRSRWGGVRRFVFRASLNFDATNNSPGAFCHLL